jgi:hypothetical protein
MLLNAMPISPSAGNSELSKPLEYFEATPRVCFFAVRPAMVTVSVYCLPETVEPSPYASENDLPRLTDVEEELGLKVVWPEQVLPQLELGRKRSLLPVSKSTVYNSALNTQTKPPTRAHW